MKSTMQVLLRPWSFADVNNLSTLADNRKIWDNVRDYFPHPYTRKKAEEWVGIHHAKNPVTHYAIDVDGKLAGGISIMTKEDIYRCTAEIGYWIGEPYWGRGIATEAIKILLEIVWHRYPEIVRIYAELFTSNVASARALEKNGFTLEAVRKNSCIKNGVIGDDMVWVLLRK
ncbi:MAG: GNAT family N-acetyltransferase [Chitinophagaceae bacterium]